MIKNESTFSKRSKVSLIAVNDNPYAAVVKATGDLATQFIKHGDTVLIKPNLVNPNPPESGQITSPRLIEAVVKYCLANGAGRVIIGEGPGTYNRKEDLRDCFTTTGVSELAERLGVEWVLFDEHNFRAFHKISDCTPEIFRVTEYVFNCDKMINLPVLKTHYLTKVTLAMKNLKGCLRWEDKIKFHQPDLCRAVVELNKIVRPTLNIIDALNWKPGGGLLIAGSDIVAVDTVGTALMGLNPKEIRTITEGAAAGLGESDITRIEIIGEELKKLKYRVNLPQETIKQYFPLLEITGAERSCSGCLIPVVSVLTELGEKGFKLKQPATVYLGRNNPEPNGEFVLVGDCANREGTDSQRKASGCAPRRETVYQRLKQLVM